MNEAAGTLTLLGMKLSLVIPVLNEVDSLRELQAQIGKVASEQSLDVEVIFVDDGSRDGSWKLIEQLSRDDSRVSGIRFREELLATLLDGPPDPGVMARLAGEAITEMVT